MSGWPIEAILAQEKYMKKKKLEGEGIHTTRADARVAPIEADSYKFLPNHGFSLTSCSESEPHHWAVKQIVDTLSCAFAYPASYVLNNRRVLIVEVGCD